MNIYVQLTRQFNDGKLRTILSSGQAVVLHHLAIMSKDGDWLVREDNEALEFILSVLDKQGARYRFGAPFDIRWMAGGWSSHFEFTSGLLRIRTDFVTRPPRITSQRLDAIWKEQESRELPFVDLVDLIELKKTNREKDYVVIGEMARQLSDVTHRLLYSRSARDIIDLCHRYPDTAVKLSAERTLLQLGGESLSKLEAALDAERRDLIHKNENRLKSYLSAASAFADLWKKIEQMTEGLSLINSHKVIVEQAEKLLPFGPGPAEAA